MALLQQAVKAGWTNSAQMKKDTDLDSIREWADFKKLLTEMDAKPATKKDGALPPAKQ